LSKLEDLFRSGFIIEDEYTQRKTELLAQRSAAPAAEEKPKEKETDVEQGTHYAGASGWHYGPRLAYVLSQHIVHSHRRRAGGSLLPARPRAA